jgi:iron complex transport system ATP-binding protein
VGALNIELQSCSFFYESDRPVFNGLSFQLDSGEILSVIGPNGCGKTTLLKCLIGIQDFDSGELRLDGRAESNPLERSKLFGYVPQLAADPVPYSVERMVVLGRSRFMGTFGRPDPRDYRVAAEAMELVGIVELAGRAFNTLSGGERQLVLIAQALATEATALVFDEPTSALDLVHQHDTVELLRGLSHERGFTIIFTSHNPSHALHISDRCLMMSRSGAYVFGGTPDVITETALQRVFGVRCRIIEHRVDGEGVSLGVLPILKPFNRRGEAG